MTTDRSSYSLHCNTKYQASSMKRGGDVKTDDVKVCPGGLRLYPFCRYPILKSGRMFPPSARVFCSSHDHGVATLTVSERAHHAPRFTNQSQWSRTLTTLWKYRTRDR